MPFPRICAEFKNLKLNVDGRSELCVKCVNAPVPDYSDESAHVALVHFPMFYLNE